MKRVLFTIAALAVVSIAFAQEYMIVENHYGGLARYDVSLIKQAYFKEYIGEGAGTKESPFNVAAANLKCSEIESEATSEPFYVKGRVFSVYPRYIYIADDETGINRIYSEATIPSSIELKQGDEVVVYGSLYHYSETLPAIGGEIVAINGKEFEKAEPQGDGTLANPYNVAGLLEATKDLATGSVTTTEIYTKGYVVAFDTRHAFDQTYGNMTFFIADYKEGYSSQLYVYRGMGLGGSKFTSADDLKVGDEVIICGKVKNYNGTFEYDQGNYLVALNGETAGGGGDTPSGAIFAYTFDGSQGDFTIENKELGSLSYVWSYDTKKYMKASGYKGGAIATESWLISPKFSLANVSAATLTFNNACNFANGAVADHIKVMVSTDGTNWTEATIADLPSGSSWTFVDSTVDLKSFVGNTNVQVAFKYVSTATVAPTWEIKSVTVK